MDLLAVLKALGDETRFSMYQELAGSTSALTATELSERLGLHANTVRIHLERLREAGLVDCEPVHRGTVGRPQHVYSLAERVGAEAIDAQAAGYAWGTEAARRTKARSCVKAVAGEMHRLGFDPASLEHGADTDIAFLHCPFRELAEAYPELVCNLHRGITEGVVDTVGGGSVSDFATLYDRDPCRVTVSVEIP